MQADGDWQAVEGVLSKDMGTVGEYLQTWKLKLSTTKTVSVAFHPNNKEAKRGLKFNYNNEVLLICPDPKYLGVKLGWLLTVSYSSQLYFSRDVEKCVVQQKEYEGWRNDCEVNTSANPWKEQRERQSEDCVCPKEREKEIHTHKRKKKNITCTRDQVQKT